MPANHVAPLLLGAVAYDPKVVTIWEGFKGYFLCHDLPFDFVLFANYERQVEALMAGHIDVAWNSPLAWVRARRLASAHGGSVRAVAMRDADRSLTSVVVVRNDPAIRTPADLRGQEVATGAIDSPQATLLPLSHLRTFGIVPERDFTVRRFDVLTGKHGDHVGGERDAAQALVAGEAAAACMLAANYQVFIKEGLLPAGATRVLTETEPFDHCNFTVVSTAPPSIERFHDLLLAMSYDDPEVRPLCDLEGLHQWQEARLSGYIALERAVDEAGFYDSRGTITARGYVY